MQLCGQLWMDVYEELVLEVDIDAGDFPIGSMRISSCRAAS